MAQPTTPGGSQAIDYADENVNSITPTSLKRASTTRLDSDTTLSDERDQANATKQRAQNEPFPPFDRPVLQNRFATDIAVPVSTRPVLTQQQRRSTGGGNPTRLELTKSNAEPDHHNGRESSSSSESSDDESAPQKDDTAPTHNQLSTKRLNQVRKRPAHGGRQLTVGNDHFEGSGRIAKDGRLKIHVNETVTKSGYLSKALGTTLTRHLRPMAQKEAEAADLRRTKFAQEKGSLQIPRLNIVIMVIGSRGDIQPFLAIGKILRDKYNHRVRVATHPAFRDFVEKEIGLEFFSVGGDPSELMAFMVKNPGLIPSIETIKAGEIGKRRESMYEMFNGFWRACINTTDDEHDVTNLSMMGTKQPFVADAIIANPPSFAHYHIAEKLCIPLHLVFTFPYTPTSDFPHPLANIKSANVEDTKYLNFMSYPLVDLMTWQGLGDLINKFRVRTLNLEPVSTLWAPGQLSRLKVTTTYLWSPSLVPKPADWGPEIDIAGYVFLDLAKSYKPPQDLEQFLTESGDRRPLVYIGFGSISGIDDAEGFARMIFDAVAKANVRAIISRGWGGMGDGMDKPDGVFLLDNVPHDWLFPKVDAVVHHGGAGTTAAGLKCGKPTMIVPFFGDQPFWSKMVAKAGAGAKQALPLKKLDSDKFAEGIRQCLEPGAKEKAQIIAKSIVNEGDGADNAVDSFHRSLPLDSMRCGIFSDRLAVWTVKHTNLRLSALAADLLVENKQLQWQQLDLIRHVNWKDFAGPGEPITGAGGVLVNAFHEAFDGIASIHETTRRDMAKREKRKRKKAGYSVDDAVAVPGKLAHAVRGASSKDAQQKHAHISDEMNLHGEAAPRRDLTTPVRQHSRDSNGKTVPRTAADSASTSTPVLIAKDIGKGLGRTMKPIVKLPSNMFYAMTLGLRNAPRLYGDKTVRPPHDTITGFRSGVQVAGQELAFGIYDGVTGLVRIPHRDVSDGGVVGLPKGIARGIGGLALKPTAGVMGVPAYTVKGIQMSLRKQFRDIRRTERWIRKARMAQGAKAVEELRKGGPTNGQRGPPDARYMSDELERLRTKVLTQWSKREIATEGETAKANGEDGTKGANDHALRSPRKADTF